MYHFIVNPNAKTKLGIKIWHTCKEVLDDRQISYRVHLTKGVGDAETITRKLTEDKDKKRTIVVMGGDGTLNEVLNGMEHFDNIRFGYIPIGSSNDFARGMKIYDEPLAILEHILSEPETMDLDYGVVTIGDESRRFIVSAGVGYDAAICEEANTSSTKKLFNKINLGKITYSAIAIKMLLKQKAAKVIYTFDKEKEVKKDKVLITAVHIQPYEGGGVMFCPEADPTDRKLDVCIADRIMKLRVLTLLPLAYHGGHVGHKGIHQYRCESLDVDFEYPTYVHTDGEVFVISDHDGENKLHSKVSFRVGENQIHFIR